MTVTQAGSGGRFPVGLHVLERYAVSRHCEHLQIKVYQPHNVSKAETLTVLFLLLRKPEDKIWASQYLDTEFIQYAMHVT